ncbi:MAG: phosphonate ABC transporter ATP-binding protein [Pseudomonadota bacterium]
MLEIKGLTKQFDTVRALDNVDLTLQSGEMVAVIGRSGAGKSTLLRCINRLETPTSGQIIFNGYDVTKLKGDALNEWRSQCAMIFQQFQLVPRLDVLTNVLIGSMRRRSFLSSMVKHFTAEERAKAIIELSLFGMEKTALQRASTLSGGQQQRVAIARAMMQDPDILLADEPIASLDPRNSHAVMEMLAQINRDRGHLVLVNLHAIDIARHFCQRVIGLRDGQLVFDAPMSDLTETALSEIYDGAPIEDASLDPTETVESAA